MMARQCCSEFRLDRGEARSRLPKSSVVRVDYNLVLCTVLAYVNSAPRNTRGFASESSVRVFLLDRLRSSQYTLL